MLRIALATGTAALAVLVAGQAAAQNLSATSSSYNAGYGRNPGDEERGVTNTSLRDANGNLVAVNGILQTGASAGASASAGAGAFGVGFGGASFGQVGGATAIGNNLNVTVQGNWNTVIIDSTQINNGDVNANVELNGQVDLDDHP
jgi:holdfast attachment protein HfaA